MAYRNPAPTVDLIIEMCDRPHRPIVLIERLNLPHGWALPGGFVDYGESVETAAVREAKEETNLAVTLIEQFAVYSAPERDERQHTLSIVFIATATGNPTAQDDAKSLKIVNPWEVAGAHSGTLCFDHGQILADYWRYRHYGHRPRLTHLAHCDASTQPLE
ncbi:MAG: NUDIX hydrolase [Cyanobacteria bacterium J06597_16]